MARKSWYDPNAAKTTVRVVKEESVTWGYRKRLHPKTAPGLLECLAYPLTDGPGIGILIFMPPVLLGMSLPLFDMIALLDTSRKNWELGLLVLPIFLPLMSVFALVFGYGLLFFGHQLVASALGEPDHPRWPDWDSHEIGEGLGRWFWATIFGLGLAGFPVVGYWQICGDIDTFDRIIFFDLVVLGTGYALMALAASLLCDSLLAANPLTVISAIAHLGFDFVMPCLTGGLALAADAGIIYCVLVLFPSMKTAVFGLWGFWVFTLYAIMAVLRMVGLTYHAHSDDLVWFHGRPRWGLPSRFGKIYSNS